MGKPLVRFCEGQEFNCDMEEILWHRRESRRKLRKQTSSYSHGSLLSTRKYWNIGLKSHDFGIGIKGFRVNFDCFTINVDIWSRDNHPLMTIMAFPDKWLSLFDTEDLLEAQNPASWDTPCVTTKCTLTADALAAKQGYCLRKPLDFGKCHCP